MKKLVTFFLFSLLLTNVKAQLYFPPTTGDTWDTISPSSLGWCQDKIDSLINYLGNRDSKAFILLKDGKIVVEKYFGTFTADSAWYWASAGKSLTSFMVGLAQQDGYLSINDPTSKYLDTGWTVCPLAKENLITIRNQLTMTTGLDDAPDNDCTIDTCLHYLADAGTRWAYHNAPYTLLDSVIYFATGQSLNAYLTQKLKNTTGMSGVYLPVGFNNVFYSKPRSFARYGLLILNKGNWDGNQIMKDTAYFNQMVNTSQNMNLSYGYLWWLNGKSSFMLPNLQYVFPGSLNPAAPNDMFAAMGKNGQLLNVVPSMSLVFIRMGDPPGGGGMISPTFNDTIWQKLNTAFCNSNSVNPIPAPKQLKIFPNPTHSNFIVDLYSQNFSILITDATGKQVYLEKNISGKKEIDGSIFSSGIYFLTAHDGTNSFRQKLIIE